MSLPSAIHQHYSGTPKIKVHLGGENYTANTDNRLHLQYRFPGVINHKNILHYKLHSTSFFQMLLFKLKVLYHSEFILFHY